MSQPGGVTAIGVGGVGMMGRGGGGTGLMVATVAESFVNSSDSTTTLGNALVVSWEVSAGEDTAILGGAGGDTGTGIGRIAGGVTDKAL